MAIFVQFFLLYVTIVNVEGFNFRAGHKKTAKGVSNVRVFSTLEVSESTTVDKPMPTSTESKTNFDWNKQWYPLAVLDCLDENKPHKYELLGNDIVVWNDGVVWRAMEDSCPHRAVPLSEGRVEKNGELLCAYHGWTFNGSGTCTNIPQADANNKESSLTNLKSCVLSYPTREEQGLLWVWAEKGLPGSDPFIESAIKSPRLIEELKECGDRVCPILYGFTELPYGADMFFENVMDPAHVPVSHHGIMGSRYVDAKPGKMSKVEASGTDESFRFMVQIQGNNDTSYDEFRPPCLQKIVTEKPNDGKFMLALYATPTTPGKTMHIGTQILIKDRDGKVPPGLGFYAIPKPMWLQHVLAPLFLHQDGVFLHHQERMKHARTNYAFGQFEDTFNLNTDPKTYFSSNFMPTSLDSMIFHFRKWLHTKGGGGPKWGPAGLARGIPKVPLPSAQLIDVYESHTKRCKVCLTALKNLKLFRNVAFVLSTVLYSYFIHSKHILALVGTAFLGGAGLMMSKIIPLFYKYEFSHQDNN